MKKLYVDSDMFLAYYMTYQTEGRVSAKDLALKASLYMEHSGHMPAESFVLSAERNRNLYSLEKDENGNEYIALNPGVLPNLAYFTGWQLRPKGEYLTDCFQRRFNQINEAIKPLENKKSVSFNTIILAYLYARGQFLADEENLDISVDRSDIYEFSKKMKKLLLELGVGIDDPDVSSDEENKFFRLNADRALDLSIMKVIFDNLNVAKIEACSNRSWEIKLYSNCWPDKNVFGKGYSKDLIEMLIAEAKEHVEVKLEKEKARKNFRGENPFLRIYQNSQNSEVSN